MPGWVDVDLPWEGVVDPTVHADGFALPFRAKAFGGAYLGHVLEHIEWDRIPIFLAELQRTLTAGSVVAVVGPDVERAVRTNQPPNIISAIVTLSQGPGGHKWVATEELTLEALRTSFEVVRAVPVATIRPPTWPNPSTAGWQCAALAVA